MRFTIRDVLWLTAIAAMGTGWWIDHQHQATGLADLKKELAFVRATANLEMDRAHP